MAKRTGAGELAGVIVLGLLVILSMCRVCTSAEPAEWSRQGKADIFFVIQTLGGDEITSFDGLAVHETDDTMAFGGGIGMNATDHFYLNTELLFGSTDFVTTIPSIPGATSTMSPTIWQWNLNLDYNVLKGRLTPLVTGGVGLFGLSGDDAAEVNFSYNVGAGGRWDITDHIVLRVLYRMTWTKLEDTDESFQFGGVVASIAYMFK